MLVGLFIEGTLYVERWIYDGVFIHSFAVYFGQLCFFFLGEK